MKAVGLNVHYRAAYFSKDVENWNLYALLGLNHTKRKTFELEPKIFY